MTSIRRLFLLVVLSLLTAGCGALDPGALLPDPTPMPGAAGTPLPDGELILTVTTPDNTPEDAELAVEFLDVVTGVPYRGDRRPLSRLQDGRWQLRTEVPLGSLVRYRYLLTAPDSAIESTAFRETVRYRVAHVPGAIQIEDLVSAWGESAYGGSSGRILGEVVVAGSGEPVAEMIVSAAGQRTFTDADGRFRLEGLPAGLHNLVAYHPDGRYRVVQQGAIVAQDSTTPAQFEVQPAEQVTMTFQVTVPNDTPSALPLRMAGSLSSLGALFAELPGGGENSSARMPELVHVDGPNYLLLTSMYAGTDLRYKYTLGDGLWNAERASDGAFLARQLIVPETDNTVQDHVASWGADSAREVRFQVTPPENSPAGDEISLQLNPFTWFEPLPMVPTEGGSWTYTLRGPIDFAGSFEYRYCRNAECGRAGTAQSLASQGPDGSLAAGGGQTVEDSIASWAWWDGPPAPDPAGAEAPAARPDWQVGFELTPRYAPTWAQYDGRSMERTAALNANSVTLTPTWILPGERPLPVIEFDPRHSRFEAELLRAASAAEAHDLDLVLRPELRSSTGGLDEWWNAGDRDATWWTVWFEEYRSFMLTHATLAERSGAARLVISGAQVGPALPGGTLADGSPSGAPPDAETRWRELLQQLRARFSGQLAYEVDAGQSLASVPPFLDAVDAVHIYWHRPLTAEATDLAEAAGRGLDGILAALPEDKPVYVSAEYLSVANSVAACPPAPDGGCHPSAAFDAGAVVDPDLAVDMQAQSQALRALLLAAAERERFAGFSARRFYPLAALQDKSASVYGKPAGDVLSYLYGRVLGIE